MSDAVNLRIDPRTGEKNWTDDISEELDVAEFDELPGVFGVLLTQVPHPTEINVYKATDPSVPLTRITTTGEPSSSQFWSDSAQLKPRGYVIVNSSLEGETLIIIYKGGGYLAHKRVLETVIPEGPPGPPGGVDTVFGRSGDVTAQSGDYTQDQVTDGTTYKQYSAAEKTKLSGIATGADVTGDAIHAASAASIADDDELGFWQIVGSVLKKITFVGIKAALFPAGSVLQEVTATDAGGTTTSTSLANLNAANVSITPKSTNSIIIVDVHFKASEALLSLTNTAGFFQLYETGPASVIGAENEIGGQAENQGVRAVAPANIRARLTNSALTTRTFQLRGRTSNASAAAGAQNMVWSIREIQA